MTQPVGTTIGGLVRLTSVDGRGLYIKFYDISSIFDCENYAEVCINQSGGVAIWRVAESAADIERKRHEAEVQDRLNQWAIGSDPRVMENDPYHSQASIVEEARRKVVTMADNLVDKLVNDTSDLPEVTSLALTKLADALQELEDQMIVNTVRTKGMNK